MVRGPTASAGRRTAPRAPSTPRRARSVVSGPSRPGCSSGAVRTSSPGPSSRPARTRTTPSLVHVVSATLGRVGAERGGVGVALARRAARSAPRRRPSRARPSAPRSSISSVGAHGRVRQRPAGAGVQVGPVGEDRELGAQGGGVHARQAMLTVSPADRPGRRAGARVEQRRAAILLGLGRGGGVAAAADARPRCRSRTGTCRGTRRRRRRRAGCRPTRTRRSPAARRGPATSGAPPVLRSTRMSWRRSRRSRRSRASDHVWTRARRRGARGDRRRRALRRARRSTSCSAWWRASAGTMGLCAVERGRVAGPSAARAAAAGAPVTAHAPHTARSLLVFIVDVTSNGRRARTHGCARAAPFRVQASGSAPRRPGPGERRREAGATPRRGRVSGTLRSRAAASR